MARKRTQQDQEMTAMDRLGLRVSGMINSPKAQLERRVTIHRLDTDPDDAWDGLMALLAETDDLDMVFNDDGTVSLSWSGAEDDDARGDGGEIAVAVEAGAGGKEKFDHGRI